MAEDDLVIRGGTIVDGTGVPRYRADLAVKDGRVAMISGKIKGGGELMVTTLGEYVYNEPTYPWVDQTAGNIDTKGVPRKGPSYIRKFADGREGQPEGFTVKLPEGCDSEAHFHTECQFQVALEGTVEFPNHPVDAIGVHYTDANTAYGGFICRTDFYLATLRPRKASGSLHMIHKENRAVRNPYGRELMGEAKSVYWEELKDIPGAQRKVIFGGEQGPAARLFEYPPGTEVQLPSASHGEWHIVVRGSARIGGEELKPYSMRYITGPEQPSPLLAGPEGVTWLLLTFDGEAEKSGAWPAGQTPTQ